MANVANHDAALNADSLPLAGIPTLREGYTWRRVTLSDAEQVAALQSACDIEFEGEAHSSVEDVMDEWNGDSIDLEHGSWLVFAPDQTLIGYMLAQDPHRNADMDVDWFVHSDHVQHNIGRFMMAGALQHLQKLAVGYPAEQIKQIRGTTYHQDHPGVALYKEFGFAYVRSYYRMALDLPESPLVTTVPAGITIRPIDAARDLEETHAMISEAFSEHWGSTPLTFEEWQRTRIETNFYHLDLSLVAVDDTTNKIVAASVNRIRETEALGWVNSLATVKQYRAKGLGRALLTRSFLNFYNAGLRKVGLGVDANNHTGATQLYIGVGMNIDAQYDTYELKL